MSRPFLELVSALKGDSNFSLDPGRMNRNIQQLRDIRTRSATDDREVGAPHGNVRVVGDPEIVDTDGNRFHYLGPALLVVHDDHGMVRTLDFVGVTSDNDYISEVWRLDVKTGKYKYKNLSGSSSRIILHARQEPEFKVGEPSWASERSPEAVPESCFFEKFEADSQTFFVDSRRGTFVRGPPFGLLKVALQNARKVVRSLFRSCSMDADVWMKKAAALTSAPDRNTTCRPCRDLQVVQVAQLAYGLASCRVF